jgi:molecular chaperone HscC
VPSAPAYQESVAVRFTYDLNGLLEVEVTVMSTGAKHRLIIEGNPGILSKEEIEKRLAALAEIKQHPRDELVNKQLMARAERMYEESLGDLRDAILHHLVNFRAVLSQQERRDVARVREEFTSFLDGLERSR